MSGPRWNSSYPELVSELRRATVGRLLALAALPFGVALILRGVPGSGPQCLSAEGPGTDLALRLELLSPDPSCTHGSLALTAAGLILTAVVLAGLLMALTRTAAAACRVWLAAPSRARIARLLRHLTAPATSVPAGFRSPVDTTPTAVAPQWAPSLRLRRGPPAVARPLPA